MGALKPSRATFIYLSICLLACLNKKCFQNNFKKELKAPKKPGEPANWLHVFPLNADEFVNALLF